MLKKIFHTTVLGGCLCLSAAASENERLVTYRAMTTELALKAALSTLEVCRDEGYQISVAVVDRGGNVQVLLRDRFAGAHTPNTAISKAWTAVSFRTDTTELTGLIQSGEIPTGIQNIPGTVFVGGGIKVEAAGSIVGGIGVSGAPGGEADERCAKAGVEAISEVLEF